MKPANILIGPDNRAVLTDFGIAWAADSQAVTTVGVLIGSPSYIAPERARGGHSGAQGDLWGLGASLYTAVEGHPPFERANALASITAVVADELAPATHAGPLWPVLSGLLRKDPDQRLDAAETERLLRGVSAAPAYVVSPAAPRASASPRPAGGSARIGGPARARGGRHRRGAKRDQLIAEPAARVRGRGASVRGEHAPGGGRHAPATASARPSTPASPHTTAQTSPATTSRPYVSYNDDPNPKSHHGHGHSKSSKGQGDDNQD